jgi:short-subunit dehydrogenase
MLTGASSGIGWHLALMLAERGAHVVATARRAERLAALQTEFEQRKSSSAITTTGDLTCIVGDVTDPQHRQRLIDVCTERWGALDCLINNAGAGAIGPFLQASEERMRQVMEVDFFAPAFLIRSALPLLKKGNRGAIVNVGSVLSHRAVPNKSEYCAAKFALRGLSESLRCELSGHGIQVIVVNPSTTRTDFFDALIQSNNEATSKSIGSWSPQRVAQAIIDAWLKGKRETVLSVGGRLLVWAGRFMPKTTDRILTRYGL